MKKILSLLLSFVILVSSLPLTVFAAKLGDGNNTIRYSVLVLDISGTASFRGSNGKNIYTADSAIEYVKKSANSFLKNLINAKGDNYVAVVTFAKEAEIVSDFTNDINGIIQKVNNLSQTDKVRDINSGLSSANSLFDSLDDSVIKNVVLVTTGMTNQGKYSYDGHYDENTIGSKWYRIDTGVKLYAYANVAYDIASEIKKNSTLYVLGLFQTMENIPEEGYEIAEFFKLTASDLASSENTFYDVNDPSQLEFVFGEIADNITSTSGLFKYAGQIEKEHDSVAEYWYSDSYFTKSSTIYNSSLATMSLCLELSTWSSYDKTDFSDPNKTKWYNSDYNPDNPEFWNDTLCNVKTLLLGNENAGDGYEGIGFNHFEANEYWREAPTKDSIGVCAARKQITDKNGDTYNLIALVVRGGGYGAEWASNFTLGESGEHSGFALARDNVLKFLDNYVAKIGNDESKKLKIWLTGYSRAGATANMVAGAINSGHTFPNNVSAKMEDIYCYTFEAPQGAVRKDITGDNSNIFNVLNLNDLVPLVAPYSWGFSRYNYQNDKTLPTQYTTNKVKFDKQLNDMNKQLQELGYSNFEYKINEISNMKNFKVDKSKFLPFGDPLWWWEDSSVDTHTVLENGINFIADDVIPSREYYYNYLEHCVRQLMGIFMDYYGTKNGLYNYVGEVTGMIEDLFSSENITYIISPMFNLNPFYSYDDRIKDVKIRLVQKISGVFGEFTSIDGFIDSIVDILSDVFVKVAIDVWNNNTDSINTVSKFVETIISSEFQGHYPEICLAWCRSLDPNYNDDIAKNTSSITRLIRINCPVDVKVYDSNNNLVGVITDDIPDETIDGIINYLNNKGEKLFYLPADESYTVEIVATDNGTVNYSISEYNFVCSLNTRLQNYYDIKVNKGDKLKAVVPGLSDEELTNNNITGSTLNYQLYHNDLLLSSDEEFSGEEIKQEEYNVTLKTEGNGGYVDGAGKFIRGSFAKLESYTLPNGKFLGWYNGDELLSTEAEYRFAVKEDIIVTAKFSDIDFYKINVETKGEGTVDFGENYLSSDIEVSLKAVPSDGYVFEKWITSGNGTFSDINSSETVYTTGTGDTTLTAVFKKHTSDNPEPSGGPSNESSKNPSNESSKNPSNESSKNPSNESTSIESPVDTRDNINTIAICVMFVCAFVAVVITTKKKYI